ncbi:hypothetical protein SUGI_1148360 [Cryptomeria japonica]|nr:hypothetical protein SUGI_1148360 [Cryptomeria japonica]
MLLEGVGSTHPTCICVSVDLSLLLLHSVRLSSILGESIIEVDYEGFPIRCFKCGRVGYVARQCEAFYKPLGVGTISTLPSSRSKGKKGVLEHSSTLQITKEDQVIKMDKLEDRSTTGVEQLEVLLEVANETSNLEDWERVPNSPLPDLGKGVK